MNEAQLKQHLERFRGCGRYLLSVAGAHTFTGINLANRELALRLCDIAKRSGAARFIDLYYFPPDGLETVLFTYRAGDAAPSAKSKGERRWPRPKATPNMQRATPNV